MDLIELWEEHTAHEFSTRDAEATLATMVDDAYVNHVPVMTGGAGKAALREFYSRDFIPSMPPDTTLTPGRVGDVHGARQHLRAALRANRLGGFFDLRRAPRADGQADSFAS